jgi:hypothetical protein
MDALAALVQVYPPKFDEPSGDRRSKGATNTAAPSSSKRTTRSSTRRAAAEYEASLENQQPPDEKLSGSNSDQPDGSDTSSSQDEGKPPQIALSNGHIQAEGGVACSVEQQQKQHQTQNPNTQAALAASKELWGRILDVTVMPPAAYHFTPGWYQTGMENVSFVSRAPFFELISLLRLVNWPCRSSSGNPSRKVPSERWSPCSRSSACSISSLRI